MAALLRGASIIIALSHSVPAVSTCGAAFSRDVLAGVSLVQTSSQIQRSPLVQKHRLARAITSSWVLDTSAVQEKINSANLTLAAVPNLLSIVNASASTLLDDVDAALNAAISTLESVKKEGARLTPDASRVVTRIADELIAGAAKFQVQLEKASTRVEDTVIKILRNFASLTDETLGAFQNAVDKANAINSEAHTLLQLERNDDHGPFDWFFGKHHTFNAARRAITKANHTVANVGAMLVNVNATAVLLLTEDTLGAAQKGLDELKGNIDLISLPLAASRIVTGIWSQLSSLIGVLTTKVISAQRKIGDQITSARIALPLLYGAADSLMDLLDSAQEAF